MNVVYSLLGMVDAIYLDPSLQVSQVLVDLLQSGIGIV